MCALRQVNPDLSKQVMSIYITSGLVYAIMMYMRTFFAQMFNCFRFIMKWWLCWTTWLAVRTLYLKICVRRCSCGLIFAYNSGVTSYLPQPWWCCACTYVHMLIILCDVRVCSAELVGWLLVDATATIYIRTYVLATSLYLHNVNTCVHTYMCLVCTFFGKHLH